MKIKIEQGNTWVIVRTKTLKDDYQFGVAIRLMARQEKLADGFEGDSMVGMLDCLAHTTEASFPLPQMADANEILETFQLWANSEGVFDFPFVSKWIDAVKRVDAPLSEVKMTPLADPNA